LGMHAEQAQDWDRASRLLARAGDNAVRQLDDKGAASLFARALAATRHVLHHEEEGTLHVQVVSISIRLADTLRMSGQGKLARAVLAEAFDNCPSAPNLKAQLMRAQAQMHASEGDVAAAITMYRKVIALAIPILALDVLSDTYLDLATMYLRLGEAQTAITELKEGIDVVTMGEGAAAVRAPHKFWRLVLRLAQLYEGCHQTTKAVTLGKHAVRLALSSKSSVGTARGYATLSGLFESLGELDKAQGYRRKAIEEMRNLGDRRTTAELLLAGSRPTQGVRRITPASVREARLLAEEVGWDEGVRQAKDDL